jgi:predicted ATP-dependent serine protease
MKTTNNSGKPSTGDCALDTVTAADPTLQLAKLPFGKGLEGDEIFSYGQLEELKRVVRLGVEHKAMTLVTGESGVGKTILPSTLRSATYQEIDTPSCISVTTNMART